MIRAGAYATVAELLPVEDCPNCQGNGEVVVERLFGRTAPEPFLTGPCAPCHGTGVVPGEWVEHCATPGCDAKFWADDGCTHMPDTPLCTDCKPARCRDCVDERAER